MGQTILDLENWKNKKAYYPFGLIILFIILSYLALIANALHLPFSNLMYYFWTPVAAGFFLQWLIFCKLTSRQIQFAILGLFIPVIVLYHAIFVPVSQGNISNLNRGSQIFLVLFFVSFFVFLLITKWFKSIEKA